MFLMGEFWNSERPVLLVASRSERGKSRHEKVETWEGHHVDSKLPQIGVEMTSKPEAGVVTPDITREIRWFRSL
jgi:hypothetical protein